MTFSLSADHVSALRRAAAQQVAVQVVAETGSTNADLLAGLGTLSGPMLLAAESQTAGRGRAGRTWLSAPGASLTFSLAWKFQRPVQELVGLSLAIGVVIADTLAPYGIHALLKWPNDVLRDGKKLAGILIETAAANPLRDDEIWAVIGIGLNIAVPSGLAERIGRPVADAPSLQIDRNLLLAELLNGLAEALIRFENDGFRAFLERWNRLHAYAGQSVIIIDRGAVLHEGIALGVDGIGRLLLDTGAGHIAVMAGDVSLRACEG